MVECGGKGNSVRDMTGEGRPLYLSDQDSAIREYAFEILRELEALAVDVEG